MEMDSKYHVGDRVGIENVRDCVFGWNDEMEEYIGEICEIKRVSWSKDRNAYSYSIDLDKQYWMWDDSCFCPIIPDLSEFAVDTAGLPSLFS